MSVNSLLYHDSLPIANLILEYGFANCIGLGGDFDLDPNEDENIRKSIEEQIKPFDADMAIAANIIVDLIRAIHILHNSERDDQEYEKTFIKRPQTNNDFMNAAFYNLDYNMRDKRNHRVHGRRINENDREENDKSSYFNFCAYFVNNITIKEVNGEIRAEIHHSREEFKNEEPHYHLYENAYRIIINELYHLMLEREFLDTLK